MLEDPLKEHCRHHRAPAKTHQKAGSAQGGGMGKRSQEMWGEGRWSGETTGDQTSLCLAGCGWVLRFSQNAYAEH